MNHNQALAAQRIDLSDVYRQGWGCACDVICVADDFRPAGLESCVVAKLFQQANAHKAVKAVVNLLDRGDIDHVLLLHFRSFGDHSRAWK